MRKHTMHTLAAAALAFSLAPAPLMAQDAAQNESMTAQERRASRLPSLISLDFDGGTVPQFEAALENASGKPVNFVYRDDVSLFEVPAVELDQVYPTTAIKLALGSVAPVRDPDDPTKQGSLMIDVVPTQTFESTVVILQVATSYTRNLTMQDALQAVAPEPVRLTFDISDIASENAAMYTGIQMPMIATAIEQMLRLGDDNPPEIEYGFHPETGLMILKAPSDKVAHEIDGVIEQLRLQAESKLRAKASERRVQISEEITKLSLRHKELDQQLGGVKTQKMIQGADADHSELDATIEQINTKLRESTVLLNRLTSYIELLDGGAPPLTALSITEQYSDTVKQ